MHKNANIFNKWHRKNASQKQIIIEQSKRTFPIFCSLKYAKNTISSKNRHNLLKIIFLLLEHTYRNVIFDSGTGNAADNKDSKHKINNSPLKANFKKNKCFFGSI